MVSARAIARRIGRPSGASAAAGITAVAAFALYSLTLGRDVAFWDTAEFQTVGPVLGIAHPTGYPSYTLLLWLASVVLQPFGEPAVRANLLSALAVATGCAAVAATVCALTRRSLLGLGAGLALAAAPICWSVALHADPHALHLCLAALLLGLLVGWQMRHEAGRPADRWLAAASVVLGVSLGNHALTVLLVPGIALFVAWQAPKLAFERRRFVLGCAALVALTTVALYLYLPIRSAMNPPLDYANPQTWEGFWYVVLAEQFHGSLTYLPAIGETLSRLFVYPIVELGPLALLAPVGAIHALRRRRALFVLLGAWWLVTFVFSLVYVNAGIERYQLVPLTVTIVFAGLGASVAWDAIGRAWRSALTPARGRSVAAALAALAAIILLAPTLILVPARYEQLDQSRDVSARLWLDTALPLFADDAVVISWWSYSTPLWYAQFVEGKRPDVFVVDDRTMIDDNLGSADDVIARFFPARPVYVIRLDQDLADLQRSWVLTPLMGSEWGFGVIYRVYGPQRVPA